MTNRPLLALALSALLAGCVAVPHVEPQLAARTAPTLGLDGPIAPVASDWWTALNDPQLDRIMADALAGNPSLDAALARLRIAEASIDVNRAGLGPQISADISEQRQRFSENYIIPPPYGGSSQWVGTAQANLSWSLDLAGRQKALISQANASANAAALDVAAARVAISGAVAQTYVGLARAEAESAVARDFVASRQEGLRLANARKRSQLASDFDIRAAETLLAEARQAQVRADGSRALMVHALAALAGRGADYYPTIAPATLVLDAALPVPAALPADLLGRRADILAALRRIDAANAGRRVARADFFPDVDLRAFIGVQALGLGNLFTGGARTYGAGPAIHLPIFESGRLRAQYQGATAQIDSAIADYNDLVVRAVREAADALSSAETARADAAEQRRILGGLQDTVRLDNVRLRTGLGSRLDILASDERLLQARQAQAGLDADGAIRRIQLLIALGGGFNPQPGPQGDPQIGAQSGPQTDPQNNPQNNPQTSHSAGAMQ